MTSISIRARCGLFLAAASLPLLVGAGAANATTVTSDGTTIRITETVPGEANDVLLSIIDDGRVDVGDTTAGLHAGGRCVWDDVIGGALCPLGPGGVIVTTGAGDDSVGDLSLADGSLPDGALQVDLGPGNDRFRGDQPAEIVHGGDGNDTLAGWGGDDQLYGDAGDDDVDGERGRDVVSGGDGQDTLVGDRYDSPYADVIDGGPGIDLLDDYSADGDPRFAAPIAVTLDGLANDGKPGENDNVTGIERLTPGSAGSFVGDDGPNVVTFPEVGAAGSLDGRGGDDVLTAGDANGDVVLGGAGNDQLAGGFGDDRIVGGPGRDTINGDRPSRCNEVHCDILGYGNDEIDARDGEVDSVACGPGDDHVLADIDDVVAADCERVERAGGVPSPAPGTPGTPGTPATPGTPGTPATPGGPAGDHTAPAVKLAGLPAGLRRGQLRSKGLTFSITTSEAGRLSARLTVKGRKAALASGSAKLKPGRSSWRLRAGATALKGLPRRTVTATLSVVVKDAAGNRSILTRRVALRP